MSQPPMKQGNSNDFMTPPKAIWPLLQYINKDKKIWECACGTGNLVNEFKRLGYDVIGTDIVDGVNFLTSYKECDVIVTNPPYSIKYYFIKRCYELKKPFAILCPLTTFEGRKRQVMFKKYGLQVLFFNKRINFTTPSGKGGGSWFMTAWFTYGLKLPNDITFVDYDNSNPMYKENVDSNVVW